MSETPQPQTKLDEELTSTPLPAENIEPPPIVDVAIDVTSTTVDVETSAEPIVTAPVETPETLTTDTTSDEIQSLTATLAEVSSQRDAFQSQYLRIAADFDNFRKRSSKEKEDIEVRVKCNTIIELLSVVDNFERARTQIKPQNEGEMGIHKSYQGVYKQLVDGLKRIGVVPMRPEGQQFDPNLHEAVMREPTEEHPEGTVMEQLQRGYYLGDKILRHALVKVAAPPEQLSAADAVDFDSVEN